MNIRNVMDYLLTIIERLISNQMYFLYLNVKLLNHLQFFQNVWEDLLGNDK